MKREENLSTKLSRMLKSLDLSSPRRSTSTFTDLSKLRLTALQRLRQMRRQRHKPRLTKRIDFSWKVQEPSTRMVRRLQIQVPSWQLSLVQSPWSP